MSERWKNATVGVLWGGLSAEREISVLTGTAVRNALTDRNYRVASIAVDPDGDWIQRLRRLDVAFIALHGKLGEDGAVQGVLEMLRLPYTGSGVLASALAMDKCISKRIWRSYGLPTARWQVMANDSRDALSLPFPVVVKPSAEGSSIGVSIVRSGGALQTACELAFRYGNQALVEAYIDGQEVTVGILDGRVLGAMEVVARGEFHSYDVKYTAGREAFRMPAPLSPDVYERVLSIALDAHSSLGCSGYSRVDTRVDQRGDVYLLEVNTLPGLTEFSYLPRIAAYVGLDYADLVEAILGAATLHIQATVAGGGGV